MEVKEGDRSTGGGAESEMIKPFTEGESVGADGGEAGAIIGRAVKPGFSLTSLPPKTS